MCGGDGRARVPCGLHARPGLGQRRCPSFLGFFLGGVIMPRKQGPSRPHEVVGRRSCWPWEGGQDTLQRGTGHTGPLARQGRHLDTGVLDQAQLLPDPVELLLLPPDVGLQHPCPLLQLLLDALEHAELGWKLQGGKHDQVRVTSTSDRCRCSERPCPLSLLSLLHSSQSRAAGQVGCPRVPL